MEHHGGRNNMSTGVSTKMSDLNVNRTLHFAGVDEPEIFYTLEGEGELVGRPSVFLRFYHCNLTCKGFASKDSPNGCDSFISWSKKNDLTFFDVFRIFEQRNYIEYLHDGTILKLTGGEPLLWQKDLYDFVKLFVHIYGFTPRIDFETNGTIRPTEEWEALMRDHTLANQITYTVSPKLASNGDPKEKRLVPNVLAWHSRYRSCFKFVIQKEEDVQEVIRDYVHDSYINVPRDRIWLMPCCGSRDEHTEKSLLVGELAKKYNLRFSPRLQLVIWNKALRV